MISVWSATPRPWILLVQFPWLIGPTAALECVNVSPCGEIQGPQSRWLVPLNGQLCRLKWWTQQLSTPASLGAGHKVFSHHACASVEFLFKWNLLSEKSCIFFFWKLDNIIFNHQSSYLMRNYNYLKAYRVYTRVVRKVRGHSTYSSESVQ